MDVNARTLKSLEWERLKSYLAVECSSDCSRELALHLELHSEADYIEHLMRENAEALMLLNEGLDLVQPELADIQSQIERLIAGASLAAKEFLALKQVLELSRKLKITYSNLDVESYPLLRQRKDRVFVFDEIVSEIDNVIDESGGIRDDASPTLRKLRREVQRISGQIRDQLQRIINSPSISKCLQEPIFTIRNGRHVLPVLANMRHSIEGIVHDSSSTGLTIYVEPMAVVELTNTIRINEAEIEREIDRLLWELSLAASKRIEDIEQSFFSCIEADFIAARARLARKYQANIPRVSKTPELRLLQARHPLLVLQYGGVDSVIPNDIILNDELQSLIITGPNTGGKTVYLKTAGLLALMLRAGLLLPVAAGSSSAIFTEIFADIGDEQSLEQNLSTFSSHMSNIVEITRTAGKSSLVLLDEIGAGTDPREGVILARVILSHLNRCGALTICSTHYGDLKTLAHSFKGFGNASMEFNDKTLAPSYKMRAGVAGSSKAIVVAARLGLDPELVEEAQQALESEKEDFEHKVDEVEQRLQALSKREEELELKMKEMSLQETELKEKTRALEEEHRRSKHLAANQFQDDYRQAKKFITELTANLQKTPSLARAQQAREGLESIKKELDWLEPEEYVAQQTQMRSGQTVRVRSLNQIGVIESMPEAEGGKAQVRVGIMKVKVPLSDLEMSAAAPLKTKARAQQNQASKKVQSAKSSQPEDPVFVRGSRNTLDLRGQRVDEGLALLERFVDESYLAHLSPLMVIHGHGTGAMKSAVRDFLKSCNYKNKSRPGENYEGGDGVTVINFS